MKGLSENNIQIVLNNMERYGGSFVKNLARLYYVADANNRKKLDETFANIFEDYKKDRWN